MVYGTDRRDNIIYLPLTLHRFFSVPPKQNMLPLVKPSLLKSHHPYADLRIL